MTSRLRTTVSMLCVLNVSAPAWAQTGGAATPPPTNVQVEAPDPDLQLLAGEPEFTLGALPTSLRMPSGKFAFRLTHRFSRPIGSGSAGDFFADFFGLDSSSQVGVELRYGIRRGTQVTFHRTNNRAIQFFGEQRLLAQTADRALGLDLIGAVEGADNFGEDFSGSIGAVVSHRFGERGAVYAHPIVVFNTSEFEAGDDHTVLLGLGTRLRLGLSRTYVVVEGAPRVGGFEAGVDHVSVGLERRAGGHVFQFTVTNAFGTTLRQVARGGLSNDDWYIGFNLTRKFY